MLRSLSFAAAVTIWTARLLAQPCADVTKFDFNNAELRIGGHGDGDPRPEQLIQLNHGTGFISDLPSTTSHDWEVTLNVNRAVRPVPSMWAKVIVLDRKHLSGTGVWRYVLVFGCAHGSLVRLFQYVSEGVALESTDGQTIRLYQAHWKDSDAHCCPSQHLELFYEWDDREHRYERKASHLLDGFNLPKQDD